MPTTPVNDTEDGAMAYALRVLAYRARSEAEIRQRLQRKGYSPAIIAHTLSELTRLGLLDDREFAREWTDTRRKYGEIRVRRELHQKGISAEIAEEVVSAIRREEEEVASARQIAERVLRTRAMPPDRDALLRVRQTLQRRGFTYEVIGQVCKDLAHQEGDWLE